MSCFQVRTDLALEARESIGETEGEVRGVSVEESYDEKNEIYKVNIRSKGPVINETAALYGGGGHKFASGVRTRNKEDIDKLLEALDNDCKIYKNELLDSE